MKKYPILHYAPGEIEEWNNETQQYRDSMPSPVPERTVVFFKGQEYTLSLVENDEPPVTPPNVIVEALLHSKSLNGIAPEWDNEWLMKKIQEQLQIIDEKGSSMFLPSEFWDEKK